MKTSEMLKEICRYNIYPGYIVFTFEFPFYGYWSFKGFIDLKNIKYKAYKVICNERKFKN